jgi:HEAT repeat protein
MVTCGVRSALLAIVQTAVLVPGLLSLDPTCPKVEAQTSWPAYRPVVLQQSDRRSPLAPDLASWRFWWRFNCDRFVAASARVPREDPQTGFVCGNDAREFYPCTPAILEKQVVPSLLQSLRNTKSTTIASACLVALARVRYLPDARERMAQVIEQSLTSSEPLIQESAVVALGVLGCESRVPVLSALLEDDGPDLRALGIRLAGHVPVRTRAFAAFALGLIGNQASPAARQVIVEALIRASQAIPKKAVERDIPVACITAIGLSKLPLEDLPPDVVQPIARGGHADSISNRLEQLQWLLTRLEDSSEADLDRAQVPIACARLVSDDPSAGALRQQVALRLLVSLRASPSPSSALRQSCAQALGQLGDCDGDAIDIEIRRILAVQARQDVDIQCKGFAMLALAQVCGRRGSGAGDALQGLEERDDPRAFLARQLREGRTPTRPWAGLALGILERSLEDAGQRSSPESMAAIRETLSDSKAPEEIGSLAIAAGLCRDIEARDVLRAKFPATSEQEARGLLAIGLGLVDDESSIALISDVLRKSRFQPDVKRSAALALALLGEGEVVPELVSMLGSAVGISSRASICSALGSIGDVRAVLPLIELLDDEEELELVRAFAADALGRIGDRNVLPWTSILSIDLNYRASTPTLWSPDECRGILDLF